MNEKMKYLSSRVRLCGLAGEVLLILAVGYTWVLSLEYSLGIIPASLFTLALIGYTLMVFRMVVKPYRETKTVYEQFALGYVLNDLFEIRYPFSPENEQAVRKFQELLDKRHLIDVSKKQAEYLALQNQINPQRIR